MVLQFSKSNTVFTLNNVDVKKGDIAGTNPLLYVVKKNPAGSKKMNLPRISPKIYITNIN